MESLGYFMNNINLRNGVITTIAIKLSFTAIRDNFLVTKLSNIYNIHYFHAQITQETKLRAGPLHENFPLIFRPINNNIVLCNDLRLHSQCRVNRYGSFKNLTRLRKISDLLRHYSTHYASGSFEEWWWILATKNQNNQDHFWHMDDLFYARCVNRNSSHYTIRT